MYDPVQFLLSGTITEWDDAKAIAMTSRLCLKAIEQVAERAVAASRGKMSTVRSFNVKRDSNVRDALRVVAGT